jgi:PIN domain nuclease of toxin-antitoxin system
MKLLDTHIMLSALGQVDLSLPENILAELMGRDDIYVSVVSIWEVAIKYRIKKLKLNIPLGRLPSVLADQNMTVLPIRADHTLSSIGPELITNDPFDRLLLGVCAAEGMRLLTMDKAMVAHPLAWR